jgi:hypothetical protein
MNASFLPNTDTCTIPFGISRVDPPGPGNHEALTQAEASASGAAVAIRELGPNRPSSRGASVRPW